eukprot:1773325-Rhodomonas_salina.2
MITNLTAKGHDDSDNDEPSRPTTVCQRTGTDPSRPTTVCRVPKDWDRDWDCGRRYCGLRTHHVTPWSQALRGHGN